MTGNVKEWCQDMYLTYKKSKIALVNPNYSDSAGTHRVARGGSFDTPDHSMTVKFHSINDFEYNPKEYGFRLAM